MTLRRTFLGSLALAFLTLPPAANAQQTGHISLGLRLLLPYFRDLTMFTGKVPG
jgi:hypothetical protein